MPWLKVSAFVLVLVGLFVTAGELLTSASGTGQPVTIAEGVSAEIGEQLFWGPGKCHTCHAIGTQGRSVRGPNLGRSAAGPEIAVRATERARERSEALGRPFSATEYLVESLTDPSAYVVEGYKDEMPVVYQPPVSLEPDELTSIILYLQSIGGEPEPATITLPPAVYAARPVEDGSAWEPYRGGDTTRGRSLFFDRSGPAACARCHRIHDEGADIGPDLTHVAGTRPFSFILESVLEPSASIASGYETVLIETVDGRLLDGVIGRETSDSLWLVSADGVETGLGRQDIVRSREQETSIMPDDLVDQLTVAQFRDLMAYLRTLQ